MLAPKTGTTAQDMIEGEEVVYPIRIYCQQCALKHPDHRIVSIGEFYHDATLQPKMRDGWFMHPNRCNRCSAVKWFRLIYPYYPQPAG